MSDIDILNQFLQRTEYSTTEKLIKDQLLELNQLIKTNNQEQDKLAMSLKEREAESLRLSGAFDAHVKLILSLAKESHSTASTTLLSGQ